MTTPQYLTTNPNNVNNFVIPNFNTNTKLNLNPNLNPNLNVNENYLPPPPNLKVAPAVNEIKPVESISNKVKKKCDDPITNKKLEIRKYFKDKVKHNFRSYQQNLDDLKKNCWERKLLHEICFKYFNRFSLTIGFFTIAITGLSGIFSYLLNVDRFEDYYTDFKIAIVIFTTISTLFQSLLKGFEWDSKSEAHNNSSEHYGQLITDIDLFQRELHSYYIETINYINTQQLHILKEKVNEEEDFSFNEFKFVAKPEDVDDLRNYVNQKYDIISKLYVSKIKEFNKTYSNIHKRNKYIIPSYAERKKDKIKLDKFIRMMKLNAEMDYIKMRSDNLKKIIDTESYEANTYDKMDLYNFHPPSISWINIDQLLNYRKLSKMQSFMKFIKNCFCPCYNSKKNSDSNDINNNSILNSINMIKKGEFNNNDINQKLSDEKWQTKHQMEKDWVLKTTEITTRLNKIREANIIENNKNEDNNIV